MRTTPLLWLCSLLLASPLFADELVTKDGRHLTIKKARKLEDGNFELTFEHGQIICAAEFVESVQIEGDMADYVPKNERERENLAKGYVRHKGKWMSKNSYKTLLKKEAEANRKRLAELEAHSAFRNGYELETRHFTFKSNTNPELLQYYADLLEAYYKLMDDRVGIKPTPTLKRTKMQVNIYKSLVDWEDQTNMAPGVIGFFSSSAQTLNFFHKADDPGMTDWVALHEATHLLTYLIQPTFRPRIWVNEGVADFFGSATIQWNKKGKLEIIPGKMQVDRMLTVKDAIKTGENMSLEELFNVEKSEFHSFEYAHAWSFVYFLNNNKNYVKLFKKFFKDFYTLTSKVKFEWQGPTRVVSGPETRRLLLASLRVKDVAKLEEEWLTYITGIEIDAPDALFRRGLKVVQRGEQEQYDQAREDLNSALEGGVQDPRLYWALGDLETERMVDLKKALKLLRQAIELSPFDPRFRQSLGLALIRGGGRRKDHDPQVEGLASLGLAGELAPDNEYYQEFYADVRRQLEEIEAKRAK